ncbi:MAG: 2-oxo acid dehydrogenase subunit E2 [Acidimicrobiales bacterium]|nr:2-oxo acid dehydrogenase subunit E2 [Acidimicrobiales bacterium]
MSEFRLPDVGEGLESAEIVEWLVAEGDRVERDQPLVEILTDKSQTQLPSPQSGVIQRLGFAVGDIAEVGQVIVEFGSAGDSVATPTPAAASSPSPPPPPAPTRVGRRPKASPVVRRRAIEAGIDLSTVSGTGPGGRITMADLDAALAPGPPEEPPALEPPPVSTALVSAPPVQTAPVRSAELGWLDRGTHPLRGIRRVTAETMARSWQIPHIHGNDEADATELLDARRRMRERDPHGAASLTPLAFFVLAVANGLRRFPVLNASIDTDNGTITVHQNINIGIAVASDAGLSVPVIRNADQRSLFNLADEIGRLTQAVRDRSIVASDLQGGTATITNYGSLGGRFATPIIKAPEVLIVGFGAIKPRPFVVDGELAARPTLPISIAVDHRLIDGDVMTAFQEFVIEQLSDPVSLLAR